MKRHTLVFASATLAVVLTGCVNPNGTQNNTGSGALIGAGTGALIGGANGRGGEGALVGAAIGLLAGGLIGNSIDQDQQTRLRQQAPQTYVRVDQGQPLNVADVKALAAAGVGDNVIISQIRNSHTVYHRGASAAQTSTVFVAQPPPPPPAETIVVAPGPDYVWIGGEWAWNGQWIWVAGRWGYPPQPRAVWVRGYWYQGPHGWGRAAGHWR